MTLGYILSLALPPESARTIFQTFLQAINLTPSYSSSSPNRWRLSEGVVTEPWRNADRRPTNANTSAGRIGRCDALEISDTVVARTSDERKHALEAVIGRSSCHPALQSGH